MNDPLALLAAKMEEARERGIVEPEAMALATATAAGVPSVRFVLCRGIDARGLRFFTNYESRKGEELEANPVAAVVFLWEAIRLQVRAEGPVQRLSAAESDDYFERRPRGHRVSAHVSAQSRPIESMDALRRRARDVAAEFEGRPVPRPAYWGGYRLEPRAVEFWTRGDDRLHERVRYERQGPAADWRIVRLAP